VHFTETCDEKLPHLITHVVTTDATKTDMEQTREIHEALAARDLLPETHVVDAGYVDAAEILHSRITYGIELLGPVSRNNQWQTKAGQGYDLSGFSEGVLKVV
jgi:transposase